jgi:hypothetical protein
MSANPVKIRFRTQGVVREPLDTGIPSTCFNVGAAARRGAVVQRQIGRPILVCRWVAVDGGRLECRWSIEVSDGSSIEERKSTWWVPHRPVRRCQTMSMPADVWDELET